MLHRLPVKRKILLLICLLGQMILQAAPPRLRFFGADDRRISYTGRIDFQNPSLPRFWSPGVYVVVRFKGSDCIAAINDGASAGSHNYITVAIDDMEPHKIMLAVKNNFVQIARDLRGKHHVAVICKATESGVGYLEFAGVQCAELLPTPPKPVRKIECIGNSITCGSGADDSQVPCGKGKWGDQHDAYRSFGAVAARALQAQWHLSSVSGIGLLHSCCNMRILMPQVFDKTDMRDDSIQWNFSSYIPDVVTVCLGQNDGAQDSVTFCRAYIAFIQKIKSYYPDAAVICLSSPMADSSLLPVMRNYLTGIVTAINNQGDKKVYQYFFTKRYHHGCDNHPNVSEHQQIADELTVFIRKEIGW